MTPFAKTTSLTVNFTEILKTRSGCRFDRWNPGDGSLYLSNCTRLAVTTSDLPSIIFYFPRLFARLIPPIRKFQIWNWILEIHNWKFLTLVDYYNYTHAPLTAPYLYHLFTTSFPFQFPILTVLCNSVFFHSYFVSPVFIFLTPTVCLSVCRVCCHITKGESKLSSVVL